MVVLWSIEVAAFREFLDWLRPMAGKFQFSQNYMGSFQSLSHMPYKLNQNSRASKF